jgi:hypothetical protein
MVMKKYSAFLLIFVLVPSVVFASWWNPFTWFRKPVPQNHMTQVATSTIPTNNFVIPLVKNGDQSVPKVPQNIPNGSKPKQTQPGTPPVTQTNTPAVVQDIQPPNTTLCNGKYWSNCPVGQDFTCPVTGSAYCQPSRQQQQAQYQQQQTQDTAAQQQQQLTEFQQAQAAQQARLQGQAAEQAQINYQAQYQVVQAKIRPLQDQYNVLEAIFLGQGCSGLSGAMGEAGIKCLLAANQAGDVSEYENAIRNNFITPVTNLSIVYENKLDDLFQQIFQVKMDYHQQLSNIHGRGSTVTQAQAEEQYALAAANAKINALNQQIQQVRFSYQNGNQ